MKSRALLLACLLTLPLVAAERADLKLKDGRVLKGARVVAIVEKTASIAHAGGLESVPIDDVPLDVLARAHIEIEDKAAEKKKVADAIAKRDAERVTPAAIQREKIDAVANAPFVPKLSPTGLEQRLIELKGKFPVQKPVKIRRNDVLVPSIDFWRSMKSDIQVATLQSLHLAIRSVEGRADAEEKRLKENKDVSARPTQQETLQWLQAELRPYLKQLRAFNDAR